MPTISQLTILLASNEPALLSVLEPILIELRAGVVIALSARAAVTAMRASIPPNLALLDIALPGLDHEFEIDGVLQAARAETDRRRIPIVLISDTLTDEWAARLAGDLVVDLVSQRAEPLYWRMRLASLLRALRRIQELEQLREVVTRESQVDSLTEIYNRTSMLSLLFRETDRVQRMNTSMCLVLFDIDDFGHWNARLGIEACDELLVQIVGRTKRLLRTYDILGRMGNDEFLLALPGCSEENAVMMAERIRRDVFSEPFHVAGSAIRLSACFGIASSLGRSPVVVLREVEQVLNQAQGEGAESIRCSADCPEAQPGPVAFLSATSKDDLLAW
jgi:two-component system cell cycle response regulator